MDLTVIIGMIAGLALIFLFGIGLVDLPAFLDGQSAAITIGGTSMAILIATKMDKLKALGAVFGKAINEPKFNAAETISTLVTFAEKARREGLLALEEDTDQLEDKFMKKGLQLVVDGTDPEMVNHILETEISQMDERHANSSVIFKNAASLAPAFGMIGTLIGLIKMLGNLSDPSSIGPSMSIALITTFYGAVLANLLFSPTAMKLDARNSEEMLMRSIMLEGILSIQAGDNPRIVEEKLKAFLNQQRQESVGTAE